MTAPLTVLQVTDTHLQASHASTLLGVDTAESFCAVLDQALGERTPHAVIASGDLAHQAEPATYQRFRTLLEARYRGPVLYVPGNHDLGEPLTQVLGGADALRLDGWEVIAFDSHVDHRTEAGFAETERDELAARIRMSAARHLLLACHHHLLPVGCPWLDKDCIPAGRELLESFAAPAAHTRSRVRGLVFGHVHQEVRESVGGMSVLGTPSTCFQFEPRSERFAIDRSPDTGQPGYRWLVLNADGTIDSSVGRVAGFPMNIELPDRF